MEKENKNMVNLNFDTLSDEQLEWCQNAVLKAQEARRKAQQAKELAERERKEEALRLRRKERAKEVEDAYKEVYEKQKKADDLMRAFIEDYGYFHTTIDHVKANPSLWDIFFGNIFQL